MQRDRVEERLRAADQPRGTASRVLRLGDETLRFDGLDETLASRLDERWGGFLDVEGGSAPNETIRVFDAGREPFFAPERPDESYRLVALPACDGSPGVLAYHFALRREAEAGRGWRLALADSGSERLDRALENATRCVVARRALRRGGFAMHSAAVLRDGRAWIFAGPSGAGKSTAVSLAGDCTPLGDDFGLVWPGDGGSWVTCAVPFDNSEKVRHSPPRGAFPVAGIWRLFQSGESREEAPAALIAEASLMASVAFPWVYPDAAGRTLDHVRRFVAESRFAHLYFTRTAPIWTCIVHSDRP